MLFNSYVFWVFFAVIFVLYRLLRHRRQNGLLLAASYFFYGYMDWRFVGLIVVFTLANFIAGLKVQNSDRPRVRKLWVLYSCLVSLGMLAFFKYAGFFAPQLDALLKTWGWRGGLGWLETKVFLPVGMSFFTFKGISYVVDVYRGETPATRRVFDFALFIALFPPLLAGPIDRGKDLLPQVLNPRLRRPDDFKEGLYLVLFGLFKKVAIADTMAAIVNPLFAAKASALSGPEIVLAVYAYTIQIYGDFAGYSDIARGVARWLGFDLMVNFRMPYVATTPTEFWSRWHISLSSWLRDYLYIPLGGNRRGSIRTYLNLMITMVLGGLWHGQGLPFLVWGAFHGAILSGYRFLGFRKDVSRNGRRPSPWVRIIGVLVMFHLVAFGWLLFRAESMGQAAQMLGQCATDIRWTPLASWMGAMLLFFAAPMLLYEYWLHRRNDILALTKVHWIPRAVVYAYMALMLLFFWPEESYAFIYFQF